MSLIKMKEYLGSEKTFINFKIIHLLLMIVLNH